MKTQNNLNLLKGSELSYQQALSLNSDSDLLASNGRYASALSLKILAAEEVMKSLVLLSLDKFPYSHYSSYKAKLSNHKPKTEWIRGLVLMSTFIEKVIAFLFEKIEFEANMSLDEKIEAHREGTKDFTQWLWSCARGENSELNKEMDWWKHVKTLREDSLYVRDNGNNKWILPSHKADLKYEETSNYVNVLLERAALIMKFDFENPLYKAMLSEINWNELKPK